MAKRNPGQAVSGAGVSKFLDKLYDVVVSHPCSCWKEYLGRTRKMANDAQLLVYEPSLEAFVARDVAWIKKRYVQCRSSRSSGHILAIFCMRTSDLDSLLT